MRTIPTPLRTGWLLPALMALALGCSVDQPVAPGALPLDTEDANAALTLPPVEGFTQVPADPPFYARIERPYVAPNNGELAAIPFYRSPECVPSDFNLLDLLDIPSAFFCQMMTTGTEWYEDAAPPFMPPYLSVLREGPEVPIWIVRWEELRDAAADDVLTIGELARLPSLQRGTATRFFEWLEPFPTRDPSMTIVEAAGTLPGGRRFTLRYREDNFTLTHFRLRML